MQKQEWYFRQEVHATFFLRLHYKEQKLNVISNKIIMTQGRKMQSFQMNAGNCQTRRNRVGQSYAKLIINKASPKSPIMYELHTKLYVKFVKKVFKTGESQKKEKKLHKI